MRRIKLRAKPKYEISFHYKSLYKNQAFRYIKNKFFESFTLSIDNSSKSRVILQFLSDLSTVILC